MDCTLKGTKQKLTYGECESFCRWVDIENWIQTV